MIRVEHALITGFQMIRGFEKDCIEQLICSLPSWDPKTMMAVLFPNFPTVPVCGKYTANAVDSDLSLNSMPSIFFYLTWNIILRMLHIGKVVQDGS